MLREMKMKTLVTALCVGTLSLGTMAAALVPAQAAPYSQQQHYKFQKRGAHVYLNGHMGDRNRHNGWRYYNGYYFPPTAFAIGGAIIGGIIGGIIANQHH